MKGFIVIALYLFILFNVNLWIRETFLKVLCLILSILYNNF